MEVQKSTEFPYPCLKLYLQKRNMPNLANYICWGIYNLDPRSKHFINLLKVRLEFNFPDSFSRIARNEAHIRLMSSMWYASSAIIVISFIGFIAGVSSNIIPIVFGALPNEWPSILVPAHPSALVLPVISAVGAIAMKDSVEKYLHYMRIREIVFVLGTFDWAASMYPDLKKGLTNDAVQKEYISSP